VLQLIDAKGNPVMSCSADMKNEKKSSSESLFTLSLPDFFLLAPAGSVAHPLACVVAPLLRPYQTRTVPLVVPKVAIPDIVKAIQEQLSGAIEKDSIRVEGGFLPQGDDVEYDTTIPEEKTA